MAAPVAPWAKTGAWATQVDEEEQANGGALPPVPAPVPGSLGGEDAFPSLGAAAAVKETKRAKKKGGAVKMSFSDFVSGGTGGRGRGKLDDTTLFASLPKGPTSRPEDEESAGIGGGFRTFGGGGADGRRDGSRYGDRDDRYGDRPPREEMGPSRADEADDWSRERKFVPGGSTGGRGGGFGGGFDRDERRDSFREREESGPSRADEADSWGRKPGAAGAGAGSGYEPPRGGGYGERRGGFDDAPGRRQYDLGSARADDADVWKRREPVPSSGGADDRLSRGAADSADRWGSRGDAGTDGPSARERPKLVLKPRTLPVEDPPRPLSASSARGSEADSASGSANGAVEAPAAAPVPAAPKPKANPFGAARPREEVLKEQGRDFVKEDMLMEHKKVAGLRPESAEEVALKSTIQELKVAAEAAPEAELEVEALEGAKLSPKEAVEKLEAKLLALSLELDDQFKFSRAAPRADDAPAPAAAAPEGSRPRW